MFARGVFGNVGGASRYSKMNDTECLYCTSSNADNGNIFKQRKITEKFEFSQYAKLLSVAFVSHVWKTQSWEIGICEEISMK